MFSYDFSAAKKVSVTGSGKWGRKLLPLQSRSAFCSCSGISLRFGLQSEKETIRIVSFQRLQGGFSSLESSQIGLCTFCFVNSLHFSYPSPTPGRCLKSRVIAGDGYSENLSGVVIAVIA